MRNRVWTAFLIGAALLAPLPAMAADDPAPSVFIMHAPSIANHCGRDARVALMPISETHKAPTYPLKEMGRPVTGHTFLRVLVDANGNAADVTVLHSSGSPVLDRAAIEGVKGVWRWETPPPECRESGVILRPGVAWDMNRDTLEIFRDDDRYPVEALARNESGRGVVDVSVSRHGALLKTGIKFSTGSAELDAAMLKITGALKYRPMRDGNGLDQGATYQIPVYFLPDRDYVQDVADSPAPPSGH